MDNNLEKQLREAFKAGVNYGEAQNQYFDKPLNEDEYIESLQVCEDPVKKIDLTFGYLKLKLSWDTICNITGLSYYCQNEGYNINDSEVFSINIDLAKELNLI